MNYKENTFYLTTTQNLNILYQNKETIPREHNTIITLWIHEIMDELRCKRVIPTYKLSINTLILDICYVTINKLQLSISEYQLSAICSIYNCLKLYLKKEVIDINNIKDYTVNKYTDEKIQIMNTVQSLIINEYVELI